MLDHFEIQKKMTLTKERNNSFLLSLFLATCLWIHVRLPIYYFQFRLQKLAEISRRQWSIYVGANVEFLLRGPFSETFELSDISMIYVVTRAGVNRRKMKLLESKWAV